MAFLTSCGGEEPASEPAIETEEVQDTLSEQEEPKPAAQPKNDEAAREARKEATEDNLMQLVLDLEEVQELDREVRKKTNGKHKVKTMISSEPGDDQEYYAVAAMEDNGQSLVTIYEFRIYPDMSIHYYDIVEDRELTLKEWRRKR
jgi:hypothetical protein